MTRTFAAAVVFGLMTAQASAQGTSPTPPPASGSPAPTATPAAIPTADAGISRTLKGSGPAAQTGTVTLFRHSATTLVAVMLDGAADRTQTVRIVRGTSCDMPEAVAAFALNDTRAGSSVSTVGIDLDRLLSGNYDIVTLASTKADAAVTACAHFVH